ncbi:hypothetical protein HNQ37_001412 [Lactovum miscens]|uniref:Uncharacterized protein n=1 Tax=Lactovum miscens TaxID=190387 RepID=A0A841CAC2_9LACT|nr:hypothetical protein [Lactovum miscens]
MINENYIEYLCIFLKNNLLLYLFLSKHNLNYTQFQGSKTFIAESQDLPETIFKVILYGYKLIIILKNETHQINMEFDELKLYILFV